MKDAQNDAEQIQPRHHPHRAAREEDGGEERIDRQFGGAAHKRREQDGHFAVALGGQGARGHHTGDGAAEADEHRDDASTGKTDAAQGLIHHEGDARHVAAVLEQGEEEEQRDDKRQEAEHAAHALEHAVDHQGTQHAGEARRDERVFHQRRQRADAGVQQIGEEAADDVEGQVEHGQHDEDEHRDGRVFAGQDAVGLDAAGVLMALVRAHDGLAANLFDEGEAHIRDGGGAIQPALLLHLHDDVFEHLLFVFGEVELLEHEPVALGQLAGGKARRDARLFGVIRDQVHDAVQTAVDGGLRPIRVAEIRTAGALLIVGDVQRVGNQLVDALALRGGNRHDRNAEHGLHLVDADGAAVFAHLVHHVERKHHRHIQLHELHGQIQVALDVGGVHDVDEAARLALEHKAAGDDLLAGVGGHGIDAGQVGHERIGMAADDAVLAIDGHAGKVADVLV